MTSYLVLTVALLVFLVGLRLCSVVGRVIALAAIGRDTMAVIRSDADDLVKEKAAQKAAAASLVAFFAISLRVAVIVGVPTALVWLGAEAGLYDLASIEAAALDWYFIIGSTVVMILAFRYLK